MVAKGTPYVMRKPCRFCMEEGELVMDGYIRHSNGQDVVRCSRCDRQCYNAPKSETGKPQTTVRTRPDLKFGQRERILERDGARCYLCGKDPARDAVQLDIAHCVSVAEGRLQGLTDKELFDDTNLFPACHECNLEMGKRSIEPRLMARLVWLRLYRNGKPE